MKSVNKHVWDPVSARFILVDMWIKVALEYSPTGYSAVATDGCSEHLHIVYIKRHATNLLMPHSQFRSKTDSAKPERNMNQI